MEMNLINQSKLILEAVTWEHLNNFRIKITIQISILNLQSGKS